MICFIHVTNFSFLVDLFFGWLSSESFVCVVGGAYVFAVIT